MRKVTYSALGRTVGLLWGSSLIPGPTGCSLCKTPRFQLVHKLILLPKLGSEAEKGIPRNRLTPLTLLAYPWLTNAHDHHCGSVFTFHERRMFCPREEPGGPSIPRQFTNSAVCQLRCLRTYFSIAGGQHGLALEIPSPPVTQGKDGDVCFSWRFTT